MKPCTQTSELLRYAVEQRVALRFLRRPTHVPLRFSFTYRSVLEELILTEAINPLSCPCREASLGQVGRCQGFWDLDSLALLSEGIVLLNISHRDGVLLIFGQKLNNLFKLCA